MRENIDAFSAPFEWSGAGGEFWGVALGDTQRTYYTVVVKKRDPKTGALYDYHMWKSRNPRGNTSAEFEAWRFCATGHEPNEYLARQPEYAAEIARWVAVAEEKAYHDAYLIAWVGASNPKAVERRIERVERQLGPDHVTVRAMRGHLAFLHGTSIGPDDTDLSAIRDYAERKGWPLG